MPYTIQPMRLRDMLKLSTWRYDGIYATYDFKFWDLVGVFLSGILYRQDWITPKSYTIRREIL
jgi:hypothetical protein